MVDTLACRAQLLLATEVLLALLEEVWFKQQVKVKGEERQRLQQEEKLLKEWLTRPLRQGKETPRVVVRCYNV